MHVISGNFVEITWTGLAVKFKVDTPDGVYDNYEKKSITIQGITEGVKRDVDVTVTPYRGNTLITAQEKSLHIPAEDFTASDAGGNSVIFCKTYNDAVLSGNPEIIKLQDVYGSYFFMKVYPSISASINETGDNMLQGLKGIDDAVLSGTPRVSEFKSSDISHYFKIYPTISAEVENTAGNILKPMIENDIKLSGTARVAHVQINGFDFYLKVYPTKG